MMEGKIVCRVHSFAAVNMQLVQDGGMLTARQKLDDEGRTHPAGKRGT